ncbi:MAG: hypothetical protein C5S48_08470 [Candidatus Methanogaster sp.]|nr:MAG: hypothetical protein C5S48_08470 [ANME-2 cluster archaeon]
MRSKFGYPTLADTHLIGDKHEYSKRRGPEPESKLGSIETENSLLLFYVLLMGVLNQTWMPPVRILEYIEKIEYSTISWSDDFTT